MNPPSRSSIQLRRRELLMWWPSLKHLAGRPAAQGQISRNWPRKLFQESLRRSHDVRRFFHCSPICPAGYTVTDHPWSQEELDKLRSLLGQRTPRKDMVTALGRSIYHLKGLYRYDTADQGYYTPERPIDVPAFRRHVLPKKIQESGPDNEEPKRVRFMWTQAEVDRIREAVASGLTYTKIAKELNRPQSSVRLLVERHEMDARKPPRRKSREWTPSEDDGLVALRASGLSVENIAKQLERPTNNVWRRLKNPSSSLSAAEDQLIATALTDGKTHAQIKAMMPDRESKHIRQRAARLGFDVGREGGWTSQDLEMLLEMKANKCAWTVIAATLGRTIGACQTRWFQVRGSDVVRKRWTNEEIETLRELKAKSLSWQEISNALPRRTDVGCEQKWTRIAKSA